jgi:hypothetical protein
MGNFPLPFALDLLTHQVLDVGKWHYGFGCRNPSLGLMTKARACKGVGQEWSLGVTFHAPRNVGKCEGMNPHTPKLAPTLGV